MKLIRTQRGHERVTLPGVGKAEDTTVTISRTPLEVSNDDADAYAKAAAAVGVATVVTDAGDDADGVVSPELPGGVVSVDPAAGIVAATGTGDPVTTDGDTKTKTGNTAGDTKGK